MATAIRDIAVAETLDEDPAPVSTAVVFAGADADEPAGDTVRLAIRVPQEPAASQQAAPAAGQGRADAPQNAGTTSAGTDGGGERVGGAPADGTTPAQAAAECCRLVAAVLWLIVSTAVLLVLLLSDSNACEPSGMRRQGLVTFFVWTLAAALHCAGEVNLGLTHRNFAEAGAAMDCIGFFLSVFLAYHTFQGGSWGRSQGGAVLCPSGLGGLQVDAYRVVAVFLIAIDSIVVFLLAALLALAGLLFCVDACQRRCAPQAASSTADDATASNAHVQRTDL